ncbi:MAG: ATP-binding protein [Symploca sp. SIO3E6]|nr:ATP-binding protein [Caldora sp. SIO3E6]
MAIGKTSSTRNQTNTSDEFSFWLASDEKVNPTDIVVVNNSDGSKTYGLITRIENLSDSESHLDNFVSYDFGDATTIPRTSRLSTNVARCVVLKNDQNSYMPVIGGCNVDFADENGILEALGIGEVKDADPNFLPLPAGVIELSNGTQASAIIDARYLLGPEGAHFNISGISGLASKTSYAMFLLNVLLQQYGNDTAVIIFNVKQDDLLYLDQSVSQITDEEKQVWEKLGAKPSPFNNVYRFCPRGILGRHSSLQTVSNTYSSESLNHQRYSYSLNNIKDKISYLFTDVFKSDTRGALEALISDIEEDLIAGKLSCHTFEDLLNHFAPTKDRSGKWKNVSYHGHTGSTIGKFRRLLKFFVKTGTTGLFSDNKETNDVSIAQYIDVIREDQIYVIDIAKLNDVERSFVVGDVVNEVQRLFSRDITYRDIDHRVRQQAFENIHPDDLDDPVEPLKKLIFFVDELNKYAPSGREITPILRNLLEITERGRSLGVILMGVEQFASDIHPRVVGNCSNKVYGRSDSTELSDQAYRHIPNDLKSLITRLDKGKLLLQHPLYRQPVQIRFPKPVYRQPSSQPPKSNENTEEK